MADPLDIPAGGKGTRGGGGSRPPRPGRGREGAPPATIIQIPPPELVAYPDARMLYGSGFAQAIANGTSSTVVDFQLSRNFVGVINSLIIFGVNLVVGLDADFALLENQAAVGGGTRQLPNQNAAAASLAWGPGEVLWRLAPGARVSVVITVNAGGPADLGAQVAGWQYPIQVRDRYDAAWRS